MKKIQLFIALICAIAFCFSGCKDEEVSASDYKTQGFIKGTITGTRASDNTIISETFNYTKYGSGSSHYTVDLITKNLYFQINRIAPDESAGSLISFVIPKDSTSARANSIRGSIAYFKETDKLFRFQMDNTGPSKKSTITFSSFSFEPSTGRVKANYNFSGPDNSTGKDATIAGEIDVILKEEVK